MQSPPWQPLQKNLGTSIICCHKNVYRFYTIYVKMKISSGLTQAVKSWNLEYHNEDDILSISSLMIPADTPTISDHHTLIEIFCYIIFNKLPKHKLIENNRLWNQFTISIRRLSQVEEQFRSIDYTKKPQQKCKHKS